MCLELEENVHQLVIWAQQSLMGAIRSSRCEARHCVNSFVFKMFSSSMCVSLKFFTGFVFFLVIYCIYDLLSDFIYF